MIEFEINFAQVVATNLDSIAGDQDWSVELVGVHFLYFSSFRSWLPVLGLLLSNEIICNSTTREMERKYTLLLFFSLAIIFNAVSVDYLTLTCSYDNSFKTLKCCCYFCSFFHGDTFSCGMWRKSFSILFLKNSQCIDR